MEWKHYWNHGPAVGASDACRQVARTLHGEPYPPHVVDAIVARLANLLDASEDRTLVELCCGNGMITSRLARDFRRVKAIDFSEPLLVSARRHFSGRNIEYVLDDATTLSSVHERYDCALVNFSLQYFTPVQARMLFVQLDRIVKPGGRIVLGEVADGDRRWNFYRGLRGRAHYAWEYIRSRPTIGHWWRPSALLELARERGWTLSIVYQTPEHPNHYFRYDAVIQTGRHPAPPIETQAGRR